MSTLALILGFSMKSLYTHKLTRYTGDAKRITRISFTFLGMEF